MKARIRGLKVIQGGGQDIERSATRRSQLIVAVIGLVMLAGGGARWAQLDEGSAQKKAVVPAAPEAQPEAAATEYFPAQYVNQAKEPEEHIQAF